MNRVLFFFMFIGFIILYSISASAQERGMGGPNPALEGKKIINKIVRYEASEYDDKKSGEMIASERIKRASIEGIRDDIMSSYNKECPVKSTIDSRDFITLVSPSLKYGKGAANWDDGVLEYQEGKAFVLSDLAKILCYISNDETLIQYIKKNQKKADEALTKIGQLQNASYDNNKQSVYDRAVNIFQATNYFKQGILSGIFKYPEKAIGAYTDAIEIYPQFSEAFYQRALLYRNLSENQKAILDYDQAIKLDKNEANYYASRGACHYDINNLKLAMKDFDRVIKLNPSPSTLYTAYAVRGSIYERNGEDEKALQDYTQAIKINTKAVDLYFRKGLINRRLRNYKESVDDFCNVIDLNSDHADAYFERGTTYAYLKDKKNVLKDFKSAAKLGNAEAMEFLKSKNIKWDE